LETRVPEAEIKIKTLALTAVPGKSDAAIQRIAESAFEFYDTYGVPREILEDIVKKNGIKFDSDRFEELINEQKDRSRIMSSMASTIFTKSEKIFKVAPEPTKFLGYETLHSAARLRHILFEKKEVEKLEKGQEGILVLDQTPFYAEQGGQVGDFGTIYAGESKAVVGGTSWYDNVIFHHVKVEDGELRCNDHVDVKVDGENRMTIMKNHTATHLLHSALRKVLGKHVKQNGSLVAPDRLRFDFTHFSALSPEEFDSVEAMVNEQIDERIPVKTLEMDTKKRLNKVPSRFLVKNTRKKSASFLSVNFQKSFAAVRM